MKLNKDLVVGAVIGAAIAGGSNTKTLKQDKKLAATAAANQARLERAERINHMVLTEQSPVTKWLARVVYLAGAGGLLVVALHIFH